MTELCVTLLTASWRLELQYFLSCWVICVKTNVFTHVFVREDAGNSLSHSGNATAPISVSKKPTEWLRAEATRTKRGWQKTLWFSFVVWKETFSSLFSMFLLLCFDSSGSQKVCCCVMLSSPPGLVPSSACCCAPQLHPSFSFICCMNHSVKKVLSTLSHIYHGVCLS